MKYFKKIGSITILLIKLILIVYLFMYYAKGYLICSDENRFRSAELNQGTLESDLIFSYLIDKSPKKSNYYLEKSVAFNKRGMFQHGFIYLNKAVEIDPVSHLGYRGWIKLYKLRDYHGALKDFNTLDSSTVGHIDYPMSENIHFLKAICLYKLGQSDESIEQFQKATQTSLDGFDDYKIKLYQAIVEYNEGRIDLSKDLLNDVIKVYPKCSDASFYLSKIYFENKNLDSARMYAHYAKKYYLSGNVLKDKYNKLPFEIYLMDIDKLPI